MQKDWKRLKKVKEGKPPNRGILDNFYYEDDWIIWLEEDKIMVSENPIYNEFIFDVDDGYFISENMGEFGGTVDFFGNDGTNYTVLECNPHFMFSIDDKIYLFEGSTHVHTRGSFYTLKKEKDKWEEDRRYDLGGLPASFAVYNGEIYVIVYKVPGIDWTNAYHELLKITIQEDDAEIQTLLSSNKIYHPNSMAIKDNMLYISLSGVIETINLKNYQIRYYVKK